MNEIFQKALSNAKANLSIFEKKKLGHSLDDILLKCSFNNQPCTSKDFTWSFDQIDGNCFSFNSGFEEENGVKQSVELKKSNIAGWNFCLSLSIYVNFHENLTTFNSYTGDGKGLYLDVANSSLGNLNSHDFDGTYIGPGLILNMALERTFKYMLPKPYSNCEIDSSFNSSSYDLVNLIIDSPYKYTQQVCFEQCYQMLLIRKCKCIDQWLLSLFEQKDDCSLNSEQKSCMNEFFIAAFNENNTNVIDLCASLCPLECNKTQIVPVSLSYVNIVGNLDADLISENRNLSSDFVTRPINEINARESVVQLNIYYNSLSYTISTESPQMNFVNLLADIGGNLGLFLGISIFSICEVIDVLIRVFLSESTQHQLIGSD